MPTHHLLCGFSVTEPPVPPDVWREYIGPFAAAGYRVVEADAGVFTDRELVSACRSCKLLPVVACRVVRGEDLLAALQVSKRLGALCVDALAGTDTMAADAAAALVDALCDEAGREGVPLVFATRRGLLTQDLRRTAALCEAAPRLRLALDLSDCAGWVNDARAAPADSQPLLETVMDRVEMLCATSGHQDESRSAKGNRVAGPIQDGATFWAEAMRRWRLRSKPGSMLVFMSHASHESAASGPACEVSGRLQQSLAVRALAQEAWRRSAGTASSLWKSKQLN